MPFSRKPPLVIYSKRTGRLANRLVAFANCLAFCEEHGFRARGIAFHSFAHLLANTDRDVICRYPRQEKLGPASKIRKINDTIKASRILVHLSQLLQKLAINDKLAFLGFRTLVHEPYEGYIDLSEPRFADTVRKSRLTLMHAWEFRDPTALRKHHAKIKDYLRPQPEVENRITQTLATVREQADIVIGVHLRHGDYRTYKEGRYFFEASEYAAIMRHVAAQLPDQRVTFHVCSDEPRSEDEFTGLNVHLSKGSPLEDLYSLAACDYLIGPTSTFTQWASYYGQAPLYGITHRDNTPALSEFKTSFLERIP